MSKAEGNVVYNVPRRRPSDIDKAVGQRIRLRRQMTGLSQVELGERCFLSPQQVHKYEQGISRVPVSRLVQFAAELRTPVSWFVEGIEEHPDMPEELFEMIGHPEYLDLVLLYHRATNPTIRDVVVKLLKDYGDAAQDPAPNGTVSFANGHEGARKTGSGRA